MIFLLFLLQQVFSLYPTQPRSGFGARAFTPQLAYTFSQADCLLGRFPEEITSNLTLVANPSATNCPIRNSFLDAAVGVQINTNTNTDVLKTGPLGSYTSLWNNGASTQSLTVEMWLTPKATSTGSNFYLLEIANNSLLMNGIPSFGTGADDTNLQIYYTTTTIQMDAAITASDGSLTGQSIIDGEHCSSFQAILTSLHNAESYQFYFAMVIDSSQAGGVPLAVLGRRNGVISNFTTCSFSAPFLGGPSGTVTAFTFNTGNVLRVGNTRSYRNTFPVPANLGFPGEINFVGMYNTALNYSALNSLFLSGLPYSIPVIKNISVSF